MPGPPLWPGGGPGAGGLPPGLVRAPRRVSVEAQGRPTGSPPLAPSCSRFLLPHTLFAREPEFVTISATSKEVWQTGTHEPEQKMWKAFRCMDRVPSWGPRALAAASVTQRLRVAGGGRGLTGSVGCHEQ